MSPGDLALIHFPFSFTEQQPFKRRPVLIVGVSSDRNAADGGILVAMVTSSAARVASPGPHDIPLAMEPESGLTLPSVCRSNRLWVAEERDFVRVLGRVTAEELGRVKADIAATFGF